MKTAITTLALFGALTIASAQTISNPSFEANSFTNGPGYISSNSPIVDWGSTDTNRAGLNPAGGGSPFADNGAIPDGTNVAFIQSASDSSLYTVITGVTIGQTYKVNFRVNARSGNTPNLKIAMDGTNIINTTVTSVGSTNPYQYFAFDFTTGTFNEIMSLSNDAGGDNTVLVDNFSIAPRNSGWSYAAWNDDASAGITAGLFYTHAYSFGSASDATVDGVTFTGVTSYTGVSPSSPGSPGPGEGPFSTTGLSGVYPGDVNNLTAGTDGSAVLAQNFVFGGTNESITISGLTPGDSYVATIYSVGFHGDTSSPARAATFSVGNDRLTVNQDQFGINNGIRVSYAYTAVSNSITLSYSPLQGSAATFHTYGFCNFQISQPIITNPSFESNSFTVYPGYISSNSPIVGWGTTDTNRAGLNPAGGTPFADNGSVPNGNNVAFIQSASNSSLYTILSNLTIGQTYKVNFRVNSRANFGNNPTPPMPNLNVAIDGVNIIRTAVTNVGGSNPYQYFAFDFTATNTSHTMSLSNDASGDQTVLVDDFRIGPRDSGWSYAAWTNDASAGVTTNLYTHAYNFGSASSPSITNVTYVTFTGIPGVNGVSPSSSGGPGPGQGPFSTTGLFGLYNGDINNLTNSTGGSAVLARDFLFGGASESITINGLSVGKSYVATIYSVGFHNDTANGTTRAATFNVGTDRLTVNQDQFGTNNGIRVSYSYTADSSKSITLTYVPLLGGYETFHTYGFANYEVSSSGHAAFLIVTNLADAGPGSLRQAIADSDSGDTITFATNGLITLTTGLLDINQNLNIVGPGPTNLAVDGNLSSRVFNVDSGSTSSISGLTIQNGRLANGGGLGNFGTLVLSNCVITGNVANGPGGFGGAIHNGPSGVLSLIACTVSGNSAGDGVAGQNGADGTQTSPGGNPGGAGSPGGNGGGIYNEGVLALAACTINNNNAGTGGGGGNGGGGYNVGGLVSDGPGGGGGDGAAGGAGGGVFNTSSGTLALTNCTIYMNSAGMGGGGGNGGTAGPIIHGVGFKGGNGGNGGNSGDGGGIYNASSAGLTMIACTVTGNASPSGGGEGSGGYPEGNNGSPGASGSGGGIQNAGTIAPTNSIVAGNSGGDISGPFGGTNNLANVNPLLAPLGNNGGLTQTMLPLSGSPAIDAGTDSVTNFLATDQRGLPRLSGAHVDIGAVEVQFVAANPNNLPVLMNPLWSGPGGPFQFTFTNVSGADFTALTTTNVALPLTDWTALGHIPEISSGQYQFTDPSATNSPRFYRVTSP